MWNRSEEVGERGRTISFEARGNGAVGPSPLYDSEQRGIARTNACIRAELRVAEAETLTQSPTH